VVEHLSHLYFIGAEGLNFIKVGRSSNPAQRLRHLRTASPYKLRLLATYEGEGSLEPYVLRILRERVGTNGEWFLAGAVQADALVLEARRVRIDTPQKVARSLESRGPTLGAAILRIRREQGLQQQDLVAKSGLSQRYLSAVENDKVDPRLSIVHRIATGLHVTIDELLRGTLPKGEACP
jgi:DNA-binding XRE family transcriptional regulator